MRQRLRLLANFAIFWISFQIIIRALFLLYNHDFSSLLTTDEIAKIFWKGLKMDISISGYFVMFTALVLTISAFTQSRWLYFVLNAITIAVLLISSIIVMVDLELYRHWGFRLDTTPLFYLTGAESEAVGSVEISVAIKLIMILLSLFTITLFVYSWWLMPKLSRLTPTHSKTAVIMMIVTVAMILPIRGSLTVAPMNTGFVYFHKTKAFANHAAINVVWNFFYNLRKSAQVEYPKNFFDNTLTKKYFESLYPQDDSTMHVFSQAKPNIVLFILESFTSDIIEPLGGLKDITPNLNQLCSEGILFDNFFSSGDRTDKGVISILSGYPAQPQTSIIKFPSKTQRLPYLNHFMRELGYATSFVYGGDVDFASLRAYLTNCRFDQITADEDFPDEVNESKWGVHDHIVFQRALEECDSAKGPFFKVILSLSSHEPFDVPMVPLIEKQDPESLFLNACNYTDKCIGEFVNKAKYSEWWKNTVILFVADHGHRYPHNKELKDKDRFRIPLLMIGGVIKKDSIVHTLSSQTDIANTLLAQLSKPHDVFKFSKNILSPNAKPFAAYFFNNGYGFIMPDAYIVYDNTGNQFFRKDGTTDEDLAISKAYQQMLYLDYNAK